MEINQVYRVHYVSDTQAKGLLKGNLSKINQSLKVSSNESNPAQTIVNKVTALFEENQWLAIIK